MGSLKEIRTRIISVNSTMQITSAMKMVSAAKLRRAQNAIVQMRPYAQKMQEILSNVSASIDSSSGGNYGEQRELKKALIVAVNSNRGLCGAFNNAVIKRALVLKSGELKDAEVSVLSIGKKANDYFKKTRYHYTGVFGKAPFQVYDDLTYENASEIADKLIKLFIDEEFDRIIMVYNRFKNAAVQIVETEQFLPVIPPTGEDLKKSDYIFEPDQEVILGDLIPRSLRSQFFKVLLDSFASEHGARMTAMHKATENANELKGELKLFYNKARQASITNEILEIVGGAEALKG